METSQPQHLTVLDRIEAGRVADGTFAVMLRLHYRLATQPGTPAAPSQSSPHLFLTAQQARELLLLVGHTLGFPGTGIEPTPPTPRH